MKQSVVFLFVMGLLCSSFVARAGIITFTDRNLFEIFINDYKVDSFTDIGLGGGVNTTRADYSWTMSSYGCFNSIGCQYGNNNPFVAAGNSWIWTYTSGQFNFNTGITAFGLDFSEPHNSSTGQLSLYGFATGLQPNGSFFGIATTDGSYLAPVSYLQSSSYMGFDNLIYSTSANGTSEPIPEPMPLAVFALSLVLLGWVSRRKAGRTG